MKNLQLLLLLLIFQTGYSQKIITDDVYRFWEAYDKIILEKDTTKQLELIQSLYINKGTPGLNGIMKARRYTDREYIYAINNYPLFWKSIRANTLKSGLFSAEIQKSVQQLKKIYPALKPVNIYFEIGLLRTGGTTIDGMLLIGSEVAMADRSTVTSEFDKRYPNLRPYFDTEPIKDVVFLNVHEYIHTQQKETIGNTLLSQTVMEGVAEFLAEIALNKKSPNPQINFGFKNEDRIKSAFEKEMFSPLIDNWIMNSPDNAFGMRDLGYFVGYAICKKYYEQATSKKMAIQQMIELDYNKEEDLVRFVEKSRYFSQPLAFYKKQFEQLQPRVTGIQQFKNGDTNVKANTKIITLTFSKPMKTNARGFDYGPLGEAGVLKVQKVIGFSEDRMSFSFEVNLEPGKQYQSIANERFRDENNYPLKPFLIDFKTAA